MRAIYRLTTLTVAQLDINGHGIGQVMNLRRLTVSPEMLRLIAEIDEFKGSWHHLNSIAPERLASLKRVAIKFGILHYVFLPKQPLPPKA